MKAFLSCLPLITVISLWPFLNSATAQTATDAPRPVLHPAKQLEQEKVERERRQTELRKENAQIDSDITDTKKQLVDVAAKVKENEQTLIELDDKIKTGQAERNDIERRLSKNRGAIGDLVLALERLNRMPSEAMIARPGAPIETAQSAMLLQSILPDIYSRAEMLKTDVAKLEEIIIDLENDQKKARETSERLSIQQKDLSALLDKRKSLYDRNKSDYASEQKALVAISAKAQNLKDLVARIEQREREAAAERTAKIEAERQKARSKVIVGENESEKRTAPARITPIPKDGSAQLPISGIIRVGYRQTDDIGAESQGLTIEGRPGALVVSPMGGVVRYAGNFKSYGRIIIVEHQKDYHSLIAGLARIDTVVGQSIAAGEPVGILSKTSRNGGKPTLYYELRLNGEPVNPARKFAGL